MCPDLSDLLQQYLEVADSSDLLLLLNVVLARVGVHLAENSRRVLKTELGGFIREALRRKQAQHHAYRVLTDRDIEVLERIAVGWSNQEIAEALGIRERTVRQHVENMQNKLDVEGRGRLVARVYGLEFLCGGSAETPMRK